MRRQAWLSLIIAGPPTGLTVLFAMTAAYQLQPDLTVIAVVAYLGVLSVSVHAWLRVQEQRGLEQQSRLRQENHNLELRLKSLEPDARTPNRDDRDPRSSPTSEPIATVVMLRPKGNAGGLDLEP
jgi:hypothetical protein